MWLMPTQENIDWLGKVLGPKGVALLSRIEVLASDEKCPAYCLSAGSLWPGCVQVIYPRGQDKNPYIYIHEMAHAYHSIYFSHLTEITTPDRAEACALLAETTLASFMDDTDPQMDERRIAWDRAGKVSEPLDHAQRIAFRGQVWRETFDVSLHNLYELILFGEFDDGRAREKTQA